MDKNFLIHSISAYQKGQSPIHTSASCEGRVAPAGAENEAPMKTIAPITPVDDEPTGERSIIGC